MASLALAALSRALAAPGALAPRTCDRRSFSHVAQSVRATSRCTAFFKLGGQNAESAGIFASQGRDEYSEDDVAHVSTERPALPHSAKARVEAPLPSWEAALLSSPSPLS